MDRRHTCDTARYRSCSAVFHQGLFNNGTDHWCFPAQEGSARSNLFVDHFQYAMLDARLFRVAPVDSLGFIVAERCFGNCSAETKLAGPACHGPGISRFLMHRVRRTSLCRHAAGCQNHFCSQGQFLSQARRLYRIPVDSIPFLKQVNPKNGVQVPELCSSPSSPCNGHRESLQDSIRFPC